MQRFACHNSIMGIIRRSFTYLDDYIVIQDIGQTTPRVRAVCRGGGGGMIEVYKILHGVYDKRVTSELLNVMDHSRTRGHSLKLAKHRSRLELRKNFFTSRVVNMWNSLTEQVISAPSVNAFENRLNKLHVWTNHLMKYNPETEYNPDTSTQEPGSRTSSLANEQQKEMELNKEASSLRSVSTDKQT